LLSEIFEEQNRNRELQDELAEARMETAEAKRAACEARIQALTMLPMAASAAAEPSPEAQKRLDDLETECKELLDQLTSSKDKAVAELSSQITRSNKALADTKTQLETTQQGQIKEHTELIHRYQRVYEAQKQWHTVEVAAKEARIVELQSMFDVVDQSRRENLAELVSTQANLVSTQEELKFAHTKLEVNLDVAARAQYEEREEMKVKMEQTLLEQGLNPKQVKMKKTASFAHCPVFKQAMEAKEALGLDSNHWNLEHDRCYCLNCYQSVYPDTYDNDGPTPYVVPRGWVRFGLPAPPCLESDNRWKKWSVSFHGATCDTVKSILGRGNFIAMPGDELPNGKTLRSTNSAGRQDPFIYTSPTVRYAGLKLYARPYQVAETQLMCQFVLQCKQEPATFDQLAETMGFRKKWGQQQLCPHVPITEIEWKTSKRQTVMPYGLLIRTYPVSDPPKEGFLSPADLSPADLIQRQIAR